MKSSVKVVWSVWRCHFDQRFWMVSGVGLDAQQCGFDVTACSRAVVDDFGNLVAVEG